LALLALVGCSQPPPAAEDPQAGLKVLVPAAPGQPSLLVFSRTQGFRHDSIPAGLSALEQLARAHGFGLSATEDARQFTDPSLASFSALIFLSTTGDVLDASGQAALERYLAAGHGWVGIHAAADCEYDWPYYGGLVGAYFGGHSLVVEASLKLEPVTHPALSGLPSPWVRTDEWYGFDTNPRPQVTVLLTADETSFDAGQGSMGPDHPVAWYHQYGGGRAFYTALGHTAESFSEPELLSHLLGGISWAANFP
jgi:type 1 glutamine amidotransferase